MGPRKYPVELLRLKRLHRRMYAHDPERGYVAELISRAEAGYKGETTVDNYLRGLRLPGESILLRNIRLQIREEYVTQFDTLLVTERGIWIIEAKMIRGSLRLLQNPRRMERTDESGAVLTMDCPILQLENQKTGLGEWLEERGLFLPIRGVVAFATRNTWTGLPDNAPIVSVKELKSMLIKSVNQPPPPEPSFSSLNEVVNCLFAEELGPDMRSFEEMGIKHGPLKEGTICENCFASLERKGERTYQCSQCKAPVEGNPVTRALRDYFLVFKPWITNREFCKFAGLRCLSTGNRYLMQHELDRGLRSVHHFDARKHLEGTELRKVKRDSL